MHSKQNEHIDDLTIRLKSFKEELVQNISDHVVEKVDISKIIIPNNNQLAVIQYTLDNITLKMEKQEVKKTTNQYKGDQGEDFVFTSLEKILTQRDGFNIKKTSKIPNNCDIKISKLGQSDISLEIKAYKSYVSTTETKKFESDIIGLNSHGIFISLYSDICGRGQVEFDLLSTGKFAIYISNGDDMETVKEYVILLYKLDTLCNSNDGFSINQESLQEIKRHLDDMNNKIGILKSNMKANITILNELSTDYVEKILLRNIKSNKAMCMFCGQEFTTKGLTNHMNLCKKKTEEKEEKISINNIFIDNGIIKL
jgi:hypothetical protein